MWSTQRLILKGSLMSIEAASVYIAMNPYAPIPWQGLTTEEQAPYKKAANTIYRLDHAEEVSSLEKQVDELENDKYQLLDELKELQDRVEELEDKLETSK